MAMMTSLIFLLGALTVAVLVSSSHGVNVYAGQFFKFPLDKDKYSADKQMKNDQVSFQFTTENNYPELPSWIDLEQRTLESSAFLYGCPKEWDKSATVEIIGWDKLNKYSTNRTIEMFNVVPNPNGFPWFQAEFLITNVNFDDFVESENETEILKIVKENYFPADDLQVTLVESALNRGGRIPLPNTHGHEGVFVRVGSHESVNETSPKYSLQTGKKPGKDAFVSNDNNFAVAWQYFTWIDLRSEVSPFAQQQALLPEDKIITTTDYMPKEFDDSPRDFNPDFVLVIILPIIIILIIVLLLSLIMCCGREGRKKRDEQTPNIQLTHHHNIQRSTFRLRELSKPGDHDQTSPQSPSNDDTSHPRRGQNEYSRLPEEGDDDRTDGRNAPPPYRMPPGGEATGGQQV